MPEDLSELGWHVWTIQPKKIDAFKGYLSKYVKEVAQVFCPTSSRKKASANGEFKETEVLIFSGYVFLQYGHNANDPKTWNKINTHPAVVGYIGPCSASDIALILK